MMLIQRFTAHGRRDLPPQQLAGWERPVRGLFTWRAPDAESDDPGYVISRRKDGDFVAEVRVEGEKSLLGYADRPKALLGLVRRDYIERRPWDVWD